MRDGIYHIKFEAPGDFGDGLVVVKGLTFNGGDSYFLYTGKLQGDSHKSSGRVSVKQWQAGNTSVFGSTGAFDLDIEVTVEHTINHVHGTGTVVGSPNQKLKFTGKLVSEAA